MPVYMDGVAESGRNLVSNKHHIQYSVFNIQYSVFNIQYSIFNIIRFSLSVENEWADAGRDGQTRLAGPYSQARAGTGKH